MMNKLVILLLSACCLLMTACDKENDETAQGFRIMNADVDLAAGGGTVEVALQATGELTAVSGADWCRVIEVTNEKITLLVRANYEYTSRATQVTVSDGNSEQKIVVTQEGNIFAPDSDQQVIRLGNAPSQTIVRVNSSFDFKVSVQQGIDWLEVPAASKEDGFLLVLKENKTGNPRACQLLVSTNEGRKFLYYVYQYEVTDLLGAWGNSRIYVKWDTKDIEVAINETYGEWMHWGTELLNRTVYNSGYVCKVVGVIKDFRIGNFTNPQAPFILMSTKNFGNCVHVRLKEPFAENLQKLNKVSADAFPDKTVDFRSMEQMIKESYNSIRVFSNATILAAVTMFFVMMMGLIGYTTDEVRRRSKEIAIRKVNGAEASGILEMLVKDVLYVAVAAVVIGVAASWYVNDMWMDMFAEHVPVSWAAYVLIAIVNLLVIVACVLWKSWRIANENPVNSLKSE